LGTIFFNTFIPSSTPCDFGGTGWLMGLDYATGATRPFRVFDTDGNGHVNSSDMVSAGLQVGAALGGTAIIKDPGAPGGNTGGTSSGSPDGGDTGATGVSSLTTGDTASTALNLGGGGTGRQSWREINP
jgi:type IV pilus assembly protein PilY1